MIAIVAAVAPELAALERRAGVRYRPSSWPSIGEGTLAGSRFLLAQTGMGSARAGEATALVVRQYQPEAILSVGFAGSLSSELRAGDLVIARQVYAQESSLDNGVPTVSDGLACDARLVELAVAAARRQKLPFHQGGSLTAWQVVSQPSLKRQIGRSLPVRMVELESYWVGRVASERGIPFLAARAILDEVGQPLPNLPGLIDEAGAIDRAQALRQLLRRPHEALALLRLAASARRAAKNLATFAEAFVDILASSNFFGRQS